MVKFEINKFMKATTVYSIAMVNQTLSNQNKCENEELLIYNVVLCNNISILDYIGFMYNVDSDLIL